MLNAGERNRIRGQMDQLDGQIDVNGRENMLSAAKLVRGDPESDDEWGNVLMLEMPPASSSRVETSASSKGALALASPPSGGGSHTAAPKTGGSCGEGEGIRIKNEPEVIVKMRAKVNDGIASFTKARSQVKQACHPSPDSG